MEQRKLYGSKYEENARLRQGWPSALTREIERARETALNPQVKFRDERNDPDFDLNQNNMEKMIADMPVEVGVLYDKHNRLVSISKGGQDTVGMQALRSQFENGVFVHNHPEGGPFSGGDVAAHVFYKLGETVALSSEGRYTLRGSPDKRFGKDTEEGIRDMQRKAMGLAGTFALGLLKGELSKSAIKTIEKAKDWRALERSLPDIVKPRFASIVNKFVGEETRKMLAKIGFEVSFTPNTSPPGYPSYDAIPILKIK